MHRMVSACARWAVLAASVALVGGLAIPARAATTGKIAGEVVDEASGQPMLGVAVSIGALRLGATTDLDGRYFAIGIPPGTYDITASLIGYTPVTKTGVVVNIDRTTPVDFALPATAIEVAGVTVVAPREVIQLDVAGSRATLDAHDVTVVPAVTSLSAAISQEPNVSGTQVRGGLPEETQLMINGHYATDERLNTFTTGHIPLTSVQEVQVLTGGFSAEYGNVRSGVINVVTRDDPRNYWFNTYSTYIPPHKPHWTGVQYRNATTQVVDYVLPGGIAKHDTVYLPAATVRESAYGRGTLEWQVFGNDVDSVDYRGRRVPKCWVTSYKVPNLATGNPWDSVETFKGWIFSIRGQRTWTWNDTVKAATKAVQYWQHRHRLTEDDYAKDPTYAIDASMGGPVPGLRSMSFLFSHRNSQTPYALASVRPAYTDFTEQLTLTYRLGGAAKVSVTGSYTSESGVGTAATNASGVGTTVLATEGGYTGAAPLKYALYRLAPIDNRYLLAGLSFSHVLSTSTQYELGFDVQQNDYQLGMWPDRYTPGGGANPDLLKYSLIAVGLAPDSMGWKDQQWMRSDTLGIAPYGHQGGGVLLDEVNTASGLQYDLGGATDNTDTSWYRSYKFRGALTSQITTHHEMKTGVELNLTEFSERQNNEIHDVGHKQWIYFDRSPTKGSGYVQDKIEYEGMILNAGLRLDYLDPNSNVYDQDSVYSMLWRKDFWNNMDKQRNLYTWLDSIASDTSADWHGRFDVRRAKTRAKLSPRLAISHPLDEHSKVFFNYGHFYNYPRTWETYGWAQNPEGTGVTPRPNPELDMPRTIMYELAYEREFTNAIYAWLLGMNPEMQYLVRISGFYKDVTREVGQIGYYITQTDASYQPINKRYAQIRGFEFRFHKKGGRFLEGWFQGSLSLRDEGAVGYVEQDRTGVLSVPESAYQVVAVTEPVWSAFVALHTPPNYSPFGTPSYVAELWTLSFSTSYRQGAQTTYNPVNLVPPPPMNVRSRDSYGSNLRLAKGFSFGRVTGEVFLDVSNVFGYRSLSSAGFTAQEWNDYLKSLHFPIKDKAIETDYGNDRIGDWPDYAQIPDHDSWAHFTNPRTYTLGVRVSL